MKTKIILAGVLVALVAAFFIFDLQEIFSLSYLKEQKEALNVFYSEHPLLVGGLFFVVYVAVAALALPAAALLTIAAGAIFGFVWGLVIVSFASSIGATIAFLLTRYLFHDSFEAKFGDRLEKLNRGIEKDGAFYVFSLRLVPAIPFVFVNSALALTKLKATTFYWASQIGMLIGTAVYVNAGTQLATVDSVGEIFTWKLGLSFALLAAFPYLAKYLLSLFRKDKLPTVD